MTSGVDTIKSELKRGFTDSGKARKSWIIKILKSWPNLVMGVDVYKY